MSDTLADQELKSFYFYKEAKGEVPSIRMTVNDKEITPLKKLSVSHTMLDYNRLIYPGRKKITFYADTTHEIGDVVELRLYHEGQRWDGKYYYHWHTTPVDNIYTTTITKRSYTPTGIKTGSIWQYECEQTFFEIAQKVTVKKDNTPSEIMPKTRFLTEYKGTEVPVVYRGEHKLSKILSDLAEYRSYQLSSENKWAMVNIENSKATLTEGDNKTVITCDPSTVLGTLQYTEDANDALQSVYWEDPKDEFTITEKAVGTVGTVGNEAIPTDAISKTGTKYKIVKGAIIEQNSNYIKKGVGRAIPVFNIYVPDTKADKRSFLKWKLSYVEKKYSFNMATAFISTSLGGNVNVAVTYDKVGDIPKLGWGGNLSGKHIDISIGDKFSFNYKIDVMRNREWEPRRFNWGDEWDTGATWENKNEQ